MITCLKIQFILLAGVLTSAMVTTAKEEATPVYPTDVRVERDTSYLGEGRKEKADPDFALKRGIVQKSAAVLVIHDGGIDPERIGVIGCSAGGNLAAMLATTGPRGTDSNRRGPTRSFPPMFVARWISTARWT
jgi:dienelactone hydrolase